MHMGLMSHKIGLMHFPHIGLFAHKSVRFSKNPCFDGFLPVSLGISIVRQNLVHFLNPHVISNLLLIISSNIFVYYRFVFGPTCMRIVDFNCHGNENILLLNFLCFYAVIVFEPSFRTIFPSTFFESEPSLCPRNCEIFEKSQF